MVAVGKALVAALAGISVGFFAIGLMVASVGALDYSAGVAWTGAAFGGAALAGWVVLTKYQGKRPAPSAVPAPGFTSP
jgi:hypothetical protein